MAAIEVTITGELIHRGELRRVGQKEVGTVEIVLECGNEKYANPVPVECYGDEVSDEAMHLRRGERVRVTAFVNGRAGTGQYEGRYFLRLKAKTVEALDAQPAEPPRNQPPAQRDPPQHAAETPSGDSELPF
jgi:hypothetical protein